MDAINLIILLMIGGLTGAALVSFAVFVGVRLARYIDRKIWQDYDSREESEGEE